MSLPLPRGPEGPYRVCFVCLGNICRSPMAEVVARAQLAEAGLDAAVTVDSAGTGDWHVGARMNPGARAVLARRGYDGTGHRARQFDPAWRPDLILGLDQNNVKDLKSLYLTNGADSSRIRLLGEVAGLGGAEVPDPYGGGPEDFARALDLIESAMPELVAQLAEIAQPPA